MIKVLKLGKGGGEVKCNMEKQKCEYFPRCLDVMIDEPLRQNVGERGKSQRASEGAKK